MDATREQVISWCKQNHISFKTCDSRPAAPDGWMFAYTGDAEDEVLLTAVFTNTEDSDVTYSDVWGHTIETHN